MIHRCIENWVQMFTYQPDILDEELDAPHIGHQQEYIAQFTSILKQEEFLQDVILANKVIRSGKPNRFGCRVQVRSNFNFDKVEQMLEDYHDKDLIEWLKYGFSISRDDDADDPTPNTVNHLGATLFPESIDAYIEKEIRLGATMGPFTIPPFLSRIGISPLSTRPKKDSSERRVILDLSFPETKSVNSGINKDFYCGKPVKLTYPTIDTLAKRISEIGRDCRVWKKDLRRFFRQLPLCPRDYSLIGYRWRSVLFFDKSVPMGLRSATYAAQKTTDSVVYVHKNRGFWSTNYLDDFGSAEERNIAKASYDEMGNILQDFGIEESKEKAVEPTTRMEFLGNTVDTVKMSIEVSQNRMDELLHLIGIWKRKQSYTKKQLQSLIGKLSFVTNCVRAGRIFISRLISQLSNFSDNGRAQIGDEILQDLQWWERFLPEYNGISILWLQDALPIDHYIASDASLIGGGAVHNKEFFHFRFPEEIMRQTTNIAQRELFTIVIALKLWGSELYGNVVKFSTDNMNCMYAINKGRTKDAFMLKCIREIAWIGAKNQFLLKAVYLNTKINTLPDALSRWFLSSEARRIVKRMTDKTWKRRSITPSIMKFHCVW